MESSSKPIGIKSESKIIENNLLSSNSNEREIKSLFKSQFNQNLFNFNPFYRNYENTKNSIKRLIDTEEECFDNLLSKRMKNLEIEAKNIDNTYNQNKAYIQTNDSKTNVNDLSRISLPKPQNISSINPNIEKTQSVNESESNINITEDSVDNNFDKTSRRKQKKPKKFKKNNNEKSVSKLSKIAHKKYKRIKQLLKNKTIHKSEIISELKVVININQTDESIEKLISLKNKGIVVKHCRKGDKFKCLLCVKYFDDLTSAELHSHMNEHFVNKFELNFKGIDRLFALNIGKQSSIETLLSRKQELKKISRHSKHKYFNHGIRLKDGFGTNAYVCLKCNILFESIQEVQTHLKLNEKLINSSDTHSTAFLFNDLSITSDNSNKTRIKTVKDQTEEQIYSFPESEPTLKSNSQQSKSVENIKTTVEYDNNYRPNREKIKQKYPTKEMELNKAMDQLIISSNE